MKTALVTAIACVAVAGTAAIAADSSPAGPEPLVWLRACRAMVVAEQRLACFDKAAQRLDDAIARHDVVVVDKQEVRRARRSLFGFELPSLGIFGAGDKNEPPFVAIDSKVMRVSGAGYGKYDITIEGGAVWRNIELLDTPPQAGDKIHIDKTMMGGYFLKTRFARSVRAQRIR